MTTQGQWQTEAIQRLEEAKVAFQSMLDLSDDALLWAPTDSKSWSLVEIADHLDLSNRDYLEVLRPVLKQASPKEAAPESVCKMSMTGRILAKFVHPDSKLKLKSPRGFKPREHANRECLAAFIESQEAVKQLLAGYGATHNLSRIKMASPESKLIRIRVIDAFQILALHGQRHLKQARRLREAPGFPG